MAITEDRIARPAQAQNDLVRRLRWLSAGWIAALAAIWTFEPVPSNPAAPTPWWAVVTYVAFLTSLGAMFVGAARRRSWGMGFSALAGGLGMVLAYGCLATGHHLGAWWLVEMGIFGGLTAASVAPRRAVRDSAPIA